MLAISSSDLTIYGVLGLIIIAFVILGLLKGFVRMTLGLVALSAGALSGLWGFQNGSSFAGVLIEDPDPWMSAAVGLVVGFAVFFCSACPLWNTPQPCEKKGGETETVYP